MLDLDAYLPQIAAGDATAFARWLATAEPPLRESLRPFCTRVDSEAILQETLLRIWQVAPRHTPDGSPNSLFRLGVRIARNLAIDEIRKTRADPVDEEAMEQALTAADAATLQASPDPLLRKVIIDCHGKLSGKPLDAMNARLAAAGAEPDEALAAQLGMRLNTFLQNFTRARKMLADCLQRHHVDLSAELP